MAIIEQAERGKVAKLLGMLAEFFAEEPKRAEDGAFKEEDHPRDKDGKFAVGGSTETPKIIKPSDNVSQVIDANFNNGRDFGNTVLDIEKMRGGVALNDPNERARIDSLKEKMRSSEGHIARILADLDGNVVEGQHRFEALKELGYKKIPVRLIGEVTHGLPTDDMQAAIKAAGPIHSDHINQIIGQVGEMLADEKGDADKVLAEYEFPNSFKKFFVAALEAVKNNKKQASDIVHDSLPFAFDKDSLREFDKDGRLHVKLSNISKATVNPYLGKEIPGFEQLGLEANKVYKLLRDPKELEKATPTFNGLPLLIKHKPTTAIDHQTDLTVGSLGTDAIYEHPYLKNSLVIWPIDAIEGVEDGTKRQLSAGYRYIPEMSPGVYEGEPYDGRMTKIVGNHVALVEDGRAGPDVMVEDSKDELLWGYIERELLRL